MKIRLVLALAALSLLVSAPARADWLFTPFVGGNFGGDTQETRTDFGISAAWMGAGVVGFEFDAGWTPDFLDQGLEDEFTLIQDSSLSTFMFNAIVGAPAGGEEGMGVRPYLAAGIGAIRFDATSDLGLIDTSSTDFGWNVGAGAMGFFNDHVGLRGDLRYFRSMNDDLEESALTADIDPFRFWRLTAGVVLRFGGNDSAAPSRTR